ncbi:TetR family transcriptional regulator [Williamsia sp. 1138]|nr:TetR family transcriptional regulator [Williamsia sp. 1138]
MSSTCIPEDIPPYKVGCQVPRVIEGRPGVRADAEARRDRLVEAGRILFADRGYDVPLEAVAEAAGVGIATLYRNFPTRLDLKLAILADGLHRSRRTLDELLAQVDEDPDGAMTRLTQMFVSLQLGALIPIIVRDQDLIPSELIDARKGNLASVGEILERAKSHGVVRESVTARDFFAGVALITRPLPALIADPMMDGTITASELTDRVLAIFVAGLRP